MKIDKNSKILHLGCGNSEFSEKMYDDGYHDNYNIDICCNVIDFMKERNFHREKMKCIIIILRSRYNGCKRFAIPR